MDISKRCVLRNTSNPAMSWIVGREGDLSIGTDGNFSFVFVDDEGQRRKLCSGIVNCLGSLEHPASKEISFQTKNSVYVFDKKELGHGLWGAERNELDPTPVISYEDYDSLRRTFDGIRRGDNQRLTLSEQQTVIRKWERVNKDISEGKTVIAPPKARESVGRER